MTALIHYLSAHWLEYSAAVVTALGIWLTTRRSLLCWPVTLAADALYLIVFRHSLLLSDALLQVFFLVFTLYGWWNWWQGVRQEGEVLVARLKVSSACLAILAGIAGTVLLGAIGTRLHAALPWLDASLASFSLVGSWWQARRQIANWWLWIIVDVLYVGEYIYKSLWPTAVLYVVLVGLAVLGLRDWSRAPHESTA